MRCRIEGGEERRKMRVSGEPRFGRGRRPSRRLEGLTPAMSRGLYHRVLELRGMKLSHREIRRRALEGVWRGSGRADTQ